MGEVCSKCGYNIYLVGHNHMCPDFDPVDYADRVAPAESELERSIDKFGLMLEEIVEERATLAFKQFLTSLGVSPDSHDAQTMIMTAQAGMRLGSGTLLQLLIEQEIIDADHVFNYIQQNTFDWGDEE